MILLITFIPLLIFTLTLIVRKKQFIVAIALVYSLLSLITILCFAIFSVPKRQVPIYQIMYYIVNYKIFSMTMLFFIAWLICLILNIKRIENKNRSMILAIFSTTAITIWAFAYWLFTMSQEAEPGSGFLIGFIVIIGPFGLPPLILLNSLVRNQILTGALLSIVGISALIQYGGYKMIRINPAHCVVFIFLLLMSIIGAALIYIGIRYPKKHPPQSKGAV